RSYRDQSVRTHAYPTPPFGSASRLCAGDRRCIEDHVRAAHCYAQRGVDRDRAERILPRRQTCLDARREPVRRECAKFQSRMPIAGQFQKTNHAAYREHAAEIDMELTPTKKPRRNPGLFVFDGLM